MPTHTGNPPVNAGTSAKLSMISNGTPEEKRNKILCFYSHTTGEKFTLIDSVYKSEAATNAGNRAWHRIISNMLLTNSPAFSTHQPPSGLSEAMYGPGFLGVSAAAYG